MEKYEGQLFDSIFTHARALARLASTCQDETSQGQAWLALHGMVWYGVLVFYHMIG